MEPWAGEIRPRRNGSLVADRSGATTGYSLLNLQDRGQLFVGPGVEVYEGMVIGENARPEDMDVNPTREKKLTNVRAAAADTFEKLIPARPLSLEQALEHIADDECVEVTPASVRVRKATLDQSVRAREAKRARSRV
jgi:GTP-binding protein